MPSWSIHLSVAKKVNEKLNLDKDLFYYGNLVPDVDKGTNIKRYDSHYYDDKLTFPCCHKETMINVEKFLKKYKYKINHPLILGYYSHLLTDNYFNNIVYSKCWVQDKDNNIVGIKLKNGKIKKIEIEDKRCEKKYYKHFDFELYGKYLYKENKIKIENKNLIKQNKELIDFLTDEMIENRINYLNSNFIKFNKLTLKEKLFKHNYKLFTKEELDKYFNDCVNHIINEIGKVSDNI